MCVQECVMWVQSLCLCVCKREREREKERVCKIRGDLIRLGYTPAAHFVFILRVANYLEVSDNQTITWLAANHRETLTAKHGTGRQSNQSERVYLKGAHGTEHQKVSAV